MSWKHIQDVRPRATLKRSCWACAEPIPVGEIYVRRTYELYGERHSMNLHLECEERTRHWESIDWLVAPKGEICRPRRTRGVSVDWLSWIVPALAVFLALLLLWLIANGLASFTVFAG